jgi:hypothetical protein
MKKPNNYLKFTYLKIFKDIITNITKLKMQYILI